MLDAVVLAGGRGTRLGGTTPKPLADLAGEPILTHVLRCFVRYGHRRLTVALGWEAERVRDHLVGSAVAAGHTVTAQVPAKVRVSAPEWTLELADTGLDTGTAGRVARLRRPADGPFLLTWCDGLADIDLDALVARHRDAGRLATMTVVRPPTNFGVAELDGDAVVVFREKPRLDDVWVNGGYFVVEPGVLDYIGGEADSWERDVLPHLAKDGQLTAYRHDGFWACLDTPEDHAELARLANVSPPPWER